MSGGCAVPGTARIDAYDAPDKKSMDKHLEVLGRPGHRYGTRVLQENRTAECSGCVPSLVVILTLSVHVYVQACGPAQRSPPSGRGRRRLKG
jgi:hypothetical protein